MPATRTRRRQRYRNGEPVQLAAHWCDGCQMARIGGVLCHEPGCPHAWKDYAKECRECGATFYHPSRHRRLCHRHRHQD